MPPKVKTIDELQKEIDAKMQEVEKLQSKRDGIAAELEAIDRKIAQLTGKSKRGPGRPKSAKKRKKSAAKKAGRPRKRAGGKPLAEYIKDVLAKHPEGLRVKEIEKAVRKAGYKTSSKDFYGIIASTVRDTDNFQKVSRGVYKLKG